MGIAVHLDVVGAIVVETLEDVVCDDKEAGDRPSIFTEGLLAKRVSLYTEFYFLRNTARLLLSYVTKLTRSCWQNTNGEASPYRHRLRRCRSVVSLGP